MANKKIKFNYIYNKDFSPEYFSGILSSISMDNNLYISFYNERTALPKTEEYQLDENGDLKEESLVSNPPFSSDYLHLVRHIKTGLIIDRESARNLIDVLEEYLEITEEEKNE